MADDGWEQQQKRTVVLGPEAISAISGAVAGGLTATFVCPLDVLKTRLQLQRLGTTGHGIAGGLANIARQEGLKGLYRGLSPTLLALLPNWAVYFTVYNKLKQTMSTDSNGCKIRATPAIHCTAAASAGAATLILTNPLWVVKTRMQTQTVTLASVTHRAVPYTGTFNALIRIAREEGLTGLFSGLAPSLMGIFHVGIQFPLYEFAKSTLAERTQRRPEDLSAVELVVASAFAKMVASTATYPHEVVRSYMHVSHSGPISGVVAACSTIFREDGIRGFYRGCLTNLLRTTPAAALTFTSFELISRYLNQLAGNPSS